MTETKAIHLCIVRKNPAGFDFLVRQYRREAYFHALGFMGNREDAADACQEAFTKAFGAMPLLEKMDRFYPWFYRILKNHCLNVIRRRRTARDSEDHVLSELQQRPNFDPGVLLEQREDSGRVWRALGSLETEFREILVLKYFREMDYDSISLHLGCPRGTVMSRLYYARKAFRREYGHSSPEHGEEGTNDKL
jgi:RNA polymerase sigma-70 factor (ECF subfamily)